MSGGRTTALLWLLGAAVLTLTVARLAPWAWQHLFPVPGAATAADPVSPTPPLPSSERVAEIVHRTLVTLGAPGAGGDDLLELPRGASARAFQEALRAHDGLAECEVYVTPVDDLVWRLRVFGAQDLLLTREVRSWLPERPVVSGSDPPELGIVFLFEERNDAVLRGIGRWKSPLAIGLPPYESYAVATARQAAWDSKEVVAVLSAGEDVAEQLAAAPDAQVALLLHDLPDGTDLSLWLAPLAERDVALIDGRLVNPTALQTAAEEAGVAYLRRASHLTEPRGDVVARNLAVRRGYGIVTVDATQDGVAAAEAFIDGAKADGYAIVFPVEVARMHAGAGGSSRGPRAP